jgi:hypothetical protein
MFGYRARIGYISPSVIANMTSQLYVAFKAIGMREPIRRWGKLMRLLARAD